MSRAFHSFGVSLLHGLQVFTNWAWGLILRNKVATWLAFSMLGIFFSSTVRMQLLFGASAIYALLVLTKSVDKVLALIGKSAATLLSAMVKTMVGGHGAPYALFLNGVLAFVGGFAIGGNNGTMLIAIGWLAILLSGGLAINKLVSKK